LCESSDLFGIDVANIEMFLSSGAFALLEVGIGGRKKESESTAERSGTAW
jgi:hypothetical protein